MARNILSLALVCLLCASAHADPLPEAPSYSSSQQLTVVVQPAPRGPVFTSVDWSISAALMATHVGDYL